MSQVSISPIYFQTNKLSSEKITGGLLMITPNKIYFAYSKNKLNIAEKLTDDSIKSFMLNSLKLLNNKIEETNKDLKLTLTQKKEIAGENFFNAEYFDYLSKYNQNGIISLGKLKPAYIKPTEEGFAALFKAFVGETLIPELPLKKKQTFYQKVKNTIAKESVKGKADIDHKFQPENINGILKPTNITLATKNGNIEILNAIDFKLKTDAVATSLYSFEFFIHALNSIIDKSGLKVKASIIIEEPELNTEAHELFDKVWKLKIKEGIYKEMSLDDLEVKVKEISKDPEHIKLSEYLMKD